MKTCYSCKHKFLKRTEMPCYQCRDSNFFSGPVPDFFEEMFKEDGVIKKHQPFYKRRPDQSIAASKLMDCLVESNHFIFEGPTGFGKTYTYGIPLMEFLYHNKNKVALIVTDGISLQEQLYHVDLPKIETFFKSIHPDFDMKFTLLKGRQNYLCLRKMSSFRAETTQEHMEVMSCYSKNELDLSGLSFVPDYTLLNQIACTKASDCKGRKCKFFLRCGYMSAKSAAAESQIIVTNYHLLFSDLETNGCVLPAHDIIIFDEAHEMPNIFRDFKERKISLFDMIKIKDDLKAANDEFDMIHPRVGEITKLSIEKRLTDLIEVLAIYFDDIFATMNPNDFEETKVLNKDFSIARIESMNAMFSSYVNDVEELYNYVEDTAIETGDENYRDYAYALKTISEKLATSYAITVEVSIPECVNSPDHVYYTTKSEVKRGMAIKPEARISIHRKPIDVSRAIYNSFLRDKTCVFTSATMATSKKVAGRSVQSFDYIKKTNGLCYTENLQEYAGKSPFNLSEQQLWYLHPNIKDPKTKEFEETLAQNIKEVILATGGGALCLFTSIKNMNNTYKALRNAFHNIRIMKQGDMPRLQLLEEFKRDRNSVLFGTKSFFTGIDVPGDSLRCLIIDKIPFPNLSDPVIQKMNENSRTFFRDHYTPLAVITLKQAVGRGVRSETDKCVICMLDFRFFRASGSNYAEELQSAFDYQKKTGKDAYDISAFFTEKEENPELDCF